MATNITYSLGKVIAKVTTSATASDFGFTLGTFKTVLKPAGAAPSGGISKINGVAISGMAKIKGVAVSSIAKINGVEI